jgi:hypothetical protein
MAANEKKRASQPQSMERRMTTVLKDGIMTKELEEILFSSDEIGKMTGENALAGSEKKTRMLSVMANTDCVFLMLNKDAFDILVRDELKREKEARA